MSKRSLFLAPLFLFFSMAAISQNKATAKYGNVTAKDFANKVYSVDSNASAVIVADIGSCELIGNSKMNFSLSFKQYRRVHILNKNGYDIASVSIPLYSTTGAEEKLDKLKAVTYNLENGEVVKTELEAKTNVFKDKLDKYWIVKKFTLPNIKEGSIIEYEYTITSDFIDFLHPWEFQGNYPCLWSEYNISIPEFLNYVFLAQGYQPFDVRDSKQRRENFKVSDNRGTDATEKYEVEANVTDYHWVIKNVPALKEESFTSTVRNHINKIEFQISGTRAPYEFHNYMGTWATLSDEMMRSESFGQALSKDNNWLGDVTPLIQLTNSSQLEKAKKIFNYVRDNFTCTDHSDLEMNQTLRNLVKTHNGAVSEINLFLTALLRHENINSYPVILSTRDHGYTHPIYPLKTRFNYVVAKVDIDGKTYLLDASDPELGFGHLPSGCYNGQARIMDPSATEINLTPDSLLERKNTTIIIINDEKGNLIGSMQQSPGYYESLEIRSDIKKNGKDEWLKTAKKNFGTDIEISNPQFDSLTKYDYRLAIKYDFDVKEEKADIVYVNPMFGEGYKENPFKSAERVYPVEMPYAMDEMYTLQMEIPQGYEIDELPKPMIVKLNDQGDGVFQYRISESGGAISFLSQVKFNRTFFGPEEYVSLREFFDLIVKKQHEQIVFKKKP